MRWPFQRQSDAAADPVAPAVQTAPVSREVLRQVRLIELRTRGLVNSLFGGEYNSVFRGQGMEFSEVREYEPGDDVRNIDWNVTARTGHPYVKKHVEERELTVLLVVDLSGSEQFGTRGRFKAELAAELAAVLALSAIRNNDRVGLILFSDYIEHVVPPRKGRRHALRMIRDVLAFRPTGRGTDTAGALDYAARLLPHRGIIFLLSDFAEHGGAGQAEQWEKTLRLVSRRHDLVAVRISDPGGARPAGHRLCRSGGSGDRRSGVRGHVVAGSAGGLWRGAAAGADADAAAVPAPGHRRGGGQHQRAVRAAAAGLLPPPRAAAQAMTRRTHAPARKRGTAHAHAAAQARMAARAHAPHGVDLRRGDHCRVSLALPTPVAAQQATAAVVPSDITVGDVFHAVLRVTLPDGASAVAPDSLALPDDLELAGRREFRTDTVDGVPRLSVIYPLTAWRPGTYELPDVTLGVVRDGRQSTLTVSLPSFDVTSVLPGTPPASAAGGQGRTGRQPRLVAHHPGAAAGVGRGGGALVLVAQAAAAGAAG
jgi:hypothetical protein